MREICTSGLKRGEGSLGVPLLLDRWLSDIEEVRVVWLACVDTNARRLMNLSGQRGCLG